MKLSATVQSADWKTEKHVPVITAPDSVKADQLVTVTVSVGKSVPHPNTTEHHIRWMALYFQADGDKAATQVAQIECTAHGESVKGPNQGPLYTQPDASVAVKLSRSGTWQAIAYCNIHGVWEATKTIHVD